MANNNSNFEINNKCTIITIIFLIFIEAFFLYSIIKIMDWERTANENVISENISYEQTVEEKNEFENKYSSIFSENKTFLNLFSLTQKILGKHETRNFEVLRANDGMLYLGEGTWPTEEDTIKSIAEDCELIYNETNCYGGDFVFVQVPYKNARQASELYYYSEDCTEQGEDRLVNLLQEKNIPVIDLRKHSGCNEYYLTDHHWTVESAFNSANIITKELDEKFSYNLIDRDFFSDKCNYELKSYNDVFLGSIGIKVGSFFSGKDDFSYYSPKFNTQFSFIHYRDGEPQYTYEGVFEKAFINQQVLIDEEYLNKYNALLYGADCESIITNKLSKNKKKVLLITHSYGRPLATYLSLHFSEVRFLDPQIGRYNDNCIDYIRTFQPDIVILMYNDILNVGNYNND